MPHSIPTLRVLPVENLLQHENHDPSLTDSIIERLRSEGFLRNPPVVAPLEDGESQYVVLDGVNLTMALRTMSIPYIPAQVIEYQKNVCIKSWNHVMLETDTENFIACTRNIPGLRIRRYQISSATENENTEDLARVFLLNGEIFALSVSGNNRAGSIGVINHLERTCREYGIVERTSLTSLEALTQAYPNFSALVIYPAFEIGAIFSFAKAGKLLPAGITRFLVSPRALRVNYPLKELVASEPLSTKNDTLQEWIQGRKIERGIRCYEESTIMFDE
jgi:hypothetical protein